MNVQSVCVSVCLPLCSCRFPFPRCVHYESPVCVPPSGTAATNTTRVGSFRYRKRITHSLYTWTPRPSTLTNVVLSCSILGPRALQAQGNPQFRETLQKAVDVQEAALKAVSDEAFHSAIDGRTRELTILPRICWLVVKGTAPRVKVNALLCLSKTFHFYVVRAAVDKVKPKRNCAAILRQERAVFLVTTSRA